MLFLVIFATLAIGFYAQTNINVQIAANERRSSDARLAAESGMAFMRYQLSLVGTQYLPENQMLTELANVLADRLNETANFSLYRLEVGMSASGDAILIPNDTNAVIPLGNGTGFRCKITRSGRQFIVKVAGRSSSGARAVPSDSGRGVEYSFDPRQIPAPLFDYGVASTGPITVDNKVSITGAPAALGSILSASQTNPAITLNGSASVSGEVSLVNPSGAVSIGGGASIAGKTGPVATQPYIHRGVTGVDFPVVDTSVFWPYVLKWDGAPNYYDSSMGDTLVNVVLPPGSYSFNSHMNILGVLYVQTPCTIKFNGGTTIQGSIVYENNTRGTLAQNALQFQGGVSFTGMQTLPTNAQFPADLHALSGTMLAAKGASVTFGGGFGTVGASIFASQVTFGANAEGTIAGSIVSLDANPMTFSSRPITIQPQSTDLWPAGTYFRSSYTLLPKTYREFLPQAEGI